ncbi:MAG: hypothetical protein QOJ15_8046 [Bradyrhizobium sp.]|nr:hypothetical protein [Bradyrhizobium sp.]
MMCESKGSSDDEKSKLGITEPTEKCWKRWDTFAECLERSAQQCGISKRMSQGIAGVVQELQDNIFEHSYLAGSGVLGFRHSGDTIEIIASDSGVGILESFRRVSPAAFEHSEIAEVRIAT